MDFLDSRLDDMKNTNKFALTFAVCRFETVGKFTPKLFDQRSPIATATILLFFTCLSPYSLAQNSPLSESSVREQEIKNQVENQVDNTFRRYLALLSLILLLLLLLNTIAACGVWFLLKKLGQQTASAEQEIESLKTDTLTEMERVLTEARQILYQLQNKNDLAHETLQTLTTQTPLPVIEAVWAEQSENNKSGAEIGELLPEIPDQSVTDETALPVNSAQEVSVPIVLPIPSENENNQTPAPVEVEEKSIDPTGAQTPVLEVEPEAQLKQAISLAKQGDKLFLEGDLEAAIESYDQALKIKPDLAEVWNNRGVALTRLQRYHEAIVSYESAIQLRYHYADAWNNRGVALGKLNHYEAAILSYQRAIDLKSNYMDAWNNRGFALAKLQKYDEAISSYNQAAKIRPDFYRIWYNKARCYAVQGQVELALENLKRATRLNPEACQKLVKRETDFDPIRQDKNFLKLNFDS